MGSLTNTLWRAWQTLTEARLEWVAAAFGLYCLAWIASSGRWRVIVRALGGHIGWPSAMIATLAGVCVNNITPTGRLGGEACRIAITRLRGQLSLTRGALATLCDRLSDVPPIAGMALIALPVLPYVFGGHVRATVIVVVVAIGVLLVVLPWLQKLAHSSVTSWRREGLRLGWSAVGRALLFSALVWGEDVLRLMAVGRACDVSLSISEAAALGVVVVVGGFVPTIGGLGAVEGALVATLLLFDVSLETAIAMTTIERVVTYGFSTVLGGIFVVTFGGRSLWTSARSGGSATVGSARPAGGS